MEAVNPDYPTRFANPFRSAGGADLVPPLAGGGGEKLEQARPVNATLLRASGADPGTNKTPLFASQDIANKYKNTDRNPFFRYQALQRLGNLVTTRSNVYAVWITVGYFEVEPAPNVPNRSVIYPDGFALGAELGTDTGEIKRHRAFFIYDRSIPVGFQRGRDLNVERGLLLSRFIE